MASSIDASTSGAGGVITTADNTGILQLKTAGTTAVTVDASQNVGIGTTSPSYKLDVVNSSSTAITQIKGSNSSTTITSASVAGAALFLTNSNNTANNFTAIYGADAGENVTSGIAFINNSDANNEGTTAFMTRPSGGSLTERMRIDSSGNLLFNSGYGSVATAYGCRAWVNFNGTSTVAIRASGNVTSITDNGTGDYTVNFTNAMPDANYSCVTSAARTINNAFMSSIYYSGGLVAGSARVRCWEDAGAAQDPNVFCVSIFR